MNYPNYIFDFYGTLADIRTRSDTPRQWKKTALWYCEHGADWKPTELRRRYGQLRTKEEQSLPDPYPEIDIRNVFSRLYIEKGIAPDKRLVEETARFFRITSIQKLRLYPWAEHELKRLRESGSRLFLLSNAQACYTVGEIKALGLENAFDGIVLSSDVGVKKPSPKILRILLDRYGLSVKDCLFIGNEPDTDIAMAAKAGMDSLYLKTETSPDGAPPSSATKVLLDEAYERMKELLVRQA